MAVDEIDKPRMSPCPHECQEGCSIYAERPSGCRTFACTWLLGFGKPAHRPDRSGLLVYGDEAEMGDTLVVTELHPNVMRSTKAQSLMKELRRTGIGLYIRRADGVVQIEGDAAFIACAEEVRKGLSPEDREKIRLKVV